MAAKTAFAGAEFAEILARYQLGDYLHSAAIPHGTIQTNYLVQTTEGRFVFRYYETRSRESVLFESDVLTFLAAQRYPCPRQMPNAQGTYVGAYRDKPYILFEFLDGQVVEQPNARQWQQLVQKAVELHNLTQGFYSPYTQYRWNYSPELCRELTQAAAERIDTPSARAKYAWLAATLAELELPAALPKGICHCDFHFSNLLFEGDRLAAVLDFDDANYTFLAFDLIGLLEYWACPYPSDTPDIAKARGIVQEYMRHRALPPIEQEHVFDVYKLSILFDCVWYFERGEADDFFEKRKIDALDRLGRRAFCEALFGPASQAPG